MFVCNFKINGKAIFKVCFIIIFIIVLIIAGISIFKIVNGANSFKTNDQLALPEIANITSNNYTNILKIVHDNLDKYLNQKICFSGYVYRVYDFKDTQFVLARDMIISPDFQTLVVGFLCDYKDANKFKDGSWVEITGKITKGEYHGQIPIIEIIDIKEIECPKEEYVYPPDDTFIPTSNISY